MKELLTFATGADHIPLLGFPSMPIIQFTSEESQYLPTASTYTLSLFLPLQLADYEDFKETLTWQSLVPWIWCSVAFYHAKYLSLT